MSDPGQLRAGDADRERVAQEIREHYAAGRLADDELDQRIHAAYAARTHAELAALRADLPALPVTRAEAAAELARRRGELQRHLLQRTGGALTPFAICMVVWLASGATGGFWPIYALIPAIVFVLRNGWRLYGPAPELDVVEAELQRDRQRERARARLRDGAVDADLERRAMRARRRAERRR